MIIEVKILSPDDHQSFGVAVKIKQSGRAPVTVPIIGQDINANSEVSAVLLQDSQKRVLESKDLFKGGNEILIRHEGAVYRMKITRQGKLILNK